MTRQRLGTTPGASRPCTRSVFSSKVAVVIAMGASTRSRTTSSKGLPATRSITSPTIE
jgi:hypothetical protein